MVELLVVIAIIGVLVALLLPAVQSARESARRVNCLSNLRQSGLATLQYHDVHGRFPPGREIDVSIAQRRFVVNGFLTLILPYHEQGVLEDIYDYDKGFDDPANEPVGNSFVEVYRCPSAPDGREMVAHNLARVLGGQTGVSAQPTDYFGIRAIQDPAGSVNFADPPTNSIRDEDGLLNDETKVAFKDVTDGTSKTIALFEMAGRPFHRVRGEPDERRDGEFLWQGPWAGNVAINVHGYDPSDPTIDPGSCYINCNSEFGAYSYHPGLIHVMLADGSARPISEDIDAMTFVYLARKSDGSLLTGY